ncbi:hypothetical protein [Gimesia aquarii]|uniref:Carboxypeptidase regulatory-like domain-containing protein n=1 Tax=Gimesia aquarii TaxID=2527964 RepID=A0A517WVH1_9PLAN|nr:hypothetical protein [Gimesia aquarii]QDU09259.1 hypothetical protein V202x_26320 [Gimesia aquarii]
MKIRSYYFASTNLIFLVILCISSGCLGSSGEPLPDLAEVTGTITLDGKPLRKANIVFEPQEVSDKGRRRASSASTEADGSYRLQYNADATGAALGNHKVTIMKMSDNPDEAGKHLIPPKYADSANSGLTAEVTQGENKFDFDLKSK